MRSSRSLLVAFAIVVLSSRAAFAQPADPPSCRVARHAELDLVELNRPAVAFAFAPDASTGLVVWSGGARELRARVVDSSGAVRGEARAVPFPEARALAFAEPLPGAAGEAPAVLAMAYAGPCATGASGCSRAIVLGADGEPQTSVIRIDTNRPVRFEGAVASARGVVAVEGGRGRRGRVVRYALESGTLQGRREQLLPPTCGGAPHTSAIAAAGLGGSFVALGEPTPSCELGLTLITRAGIVPVQGLPGDLHVHHLFPEEDGVSFVWQPRDEESREPRGTRRFARVGFDGALRGAAISLDRAAFAPAAYRGMRFARVEAHPPTLRFSRDDLAGAPLAPPLDIAQITSRDRLPVPHALAALPAVGAEVGGYLLVYATRELRRWRLFLVKIACAPGQRPAT